MTRNKKTALPAQFVPGQHNPNNLTIEQLRGYLEDTKTMTFLKDSPRVWHKADYITVWETFFPRPEEIKKAEATRRKQRAREKKKRLDPLLRTRPRKRKISEVDGPAISNETDPAMSSCAVVIAETQEDDDDEPAPDPSLIADLESVLVARPGVAALARPLDSAEAMDVSVDPLSPMASPCSTPTRQRSRAQATVCGAPDGSEAMEIEVVVPQVVDEPCTPGTPATPATAKAEQPNEPATEERPLKRRKSLSFSDSPSIRIVDLDQPVAHLMDTEKRSARAHVKDMILAALDALDPGGADEEAVTEQLREQFGLAHATLKTVWMQLDLLVRGGAVTRSGARFRLVRRADDT